MGLDNLSPKLQNQVNIAMKAWLVENLKVSYGDYAPDFLVDIIKALHPETFDMIFEQVQSKIAEMKAQKIA